MTRALATVLAFVCASMLAVDLPAQEPQGSPRPPAEPKPSTEPKPPAEPKGEIEVNIAYMPATGAESLEVEQPMGRLTLRAWDRPEVKIVARKRAPSSAALDRLKVNVEMSGGRIRVQTGVRIGDTLRRLPPMAAPAPAPDDQPSAQAPAQAPAQAIDLTIDAPRGVALNARTWNGDLEASGFRAGAVLRSEGGEVRASDIDGRVRTNALKGRQRLASIHGDVEADGVTGDLELLAVDGEVLVARVVEGQITAREVRTPVVRLFTTAGGIVLVGSLRIGGHYQLTALDGNVTLKLPKAPFSLDARAPQGRVRSAFALPGASPAPLRLVGDFQGGGPQLDLSAARGDVVLDTY